VTVPISWYLLLAAALFCIGTVGALTRRNGISIFLSIELMLNAANLTLIAYARQLESQVGQVIGRGSRGPRPVHRRVPPAAHDRPQPHQPPALVR
jgi:multisubunit Na+/H+ antiporter MnhC subunit